jgi:sigma-B regulation protein RsbU (phosphoserine phosphatase)
VVPPVMPSAAETVVVSEVGGRVDLAAGRRGLEYLLGLTVDEPVPPLVDPAAEAARLAAVRCYEILDSPPDGAFDRVTAMAARLLRVPVAVVSIVDSDRVWFASHHGLDLSEVQRGPGLCAAAVWEHEPLVIPDARLDPVASDNPLVAGDMGVCFYAGAPLRTADGFGLGTCCVMDYEPRRLSAEQVATLTDLAAMVVHELDVRLSARQALRAESELRRRAEANHTHLGQVARAFQATLLPTVIPAVPGADLAALYRPAAGSEVGGDFYDVFGLSDDESALVLGDVCGKGVEAAVTASLARHAGRAAVTDHDDPAQVLTVVNKALRVGVDRRDGPARFCTMIVAKLTSTGNGLRVRMAIGGHPLPLVRRSGGTVAEVGAPGSLVGPWPEPSFTTTSFHLYPGESLTLFTDGLTETAADTATDTSTGTHADPFGREGALADLLQRCTGSAQQIVDRLDQASTGAGRRQRDDLAILTLRATTGATTDATTERASSVPAHPAACPHTGG